MMTPVLLVSEDSVSQQDEEVNLHETKTEDKTGNFRWIPLSNHITPIERLYQFILTIPSSTVSIRVLCDYVFRSTITMKLFFAHLLIM